VFDDQSECVLWVMKNKKYIFILRLSVRLRIQSSSTNLLRST